MFAVIALIVYGSLYPWHFEARVLLENPLLTLIHSWGGTRDRRFVADVLVNLALYVPLGMSAHLAFRRYRLAGPVLLGAALSGLIEMTQIFEPGRTCSAVDWLNNTVGSVLGVGAGLFFERTAGRRRLHIGDRAALSLVFCWAGSLLFPLFPVMWLSVYRAKVEVLRHISWFDPAVWLWATACWFVAGCLLTAAGFRSRVWLAFSLVMVPAQFFIMTRDPTPSELLGALSGTAFLFLAGAQVPKKRIAWGFLIVLAIEGLTPLHLSSPHSFSLIPFGGFLTMDWQRGVQVLVEKCFAYGAALWLINQGGMRMVRATLLVAGVLGAIEIAQIWLPERTAEITDPLLALILGWGLSRIRGAVAHR